MVMPVSVGDLDRKVFVISANFWTPPMKEVVAYDFKPTDPIDHLINFAGRWLAQIELQMEFADVGAECWNMKANEGGSRLTAKYAVWGECVHRCGRGLRLANQMYTKAALDHRTSVANPNIYLERFAEMLRAVRS